MLHHIKGDKVRVKCGSFAGERGILVRSIADKWTVQLVSQGRQVLILATDLTNFSLAARRAWQSMPERKVGRPLGSKVSDRISVIFRIDRGLWNDFIAAEEAGLLGDRTTVINDCLRNAVAAAQRSRSKAS